MYMHVRHSIKGYKTIYNNVGASVGKIIATRSIISCLSHMTPFFSEDGVGQLSQIGRTVPLRGQILSCRFSWCLGHILERQLTPKYPKHTYFSSSTSTSLLTGTTFLTAQNCSQQGLWIILCNGVMISGKRHYCWAFQMYFLGLWTQLEHHLVPLY